MDSTSTSPPTYDYTDDDDLQFTNPSTPEKRKRSSRACDQCRKTKSKCERIPGASACRNCLNISQECTFLGPSRKRGPPKGYITTLETRVHRLEALWGVLLNARGDSIIDNLIQDIAQDGLGRDILSEVQDGAFGPIGRARILQSHDRDLMESESNPSKKFISSRARREQYIVGNEQDPSLPSYQWQDKLMNHIVARNLARKHGKTEQGPGNISAPYAFTTDESGFQTETADDPGFLAVKEASPLLGTQALSSWRPYDAETLWHVLYDRTMPSSGEESEYESDDPADAVGQLSLNEKDQVGFLGKTSGMHLLAKPQRSDNLNRGGIWHLPQSRYWPKSLRRHPMIEEDLRLNIPLPSQEIQNQLLELYWTYVQPVLPVLDRARFLEEYNAGPESSEPQSAGGSERSKAMRPIPRLLLLSMFTIAARYSNHEPLPPKGKMWEAGCEYLDDAKIILNWTYDSPRPSTCQALLLLAYREFGIGAISQAWIYMGMAIRMATDLGMHRAADQWQRSGRILFTEAEKSSRKRIWHCCVILDRIMAFAMGRPMYIRERDYDTTLPSIEDDEETQIWGPTLSTGLRQSNRTLSTLNTSASLSSILALVVDTIYACRSGVSFVQRHVESFKISTQLDEWYREMPAHLQYHADVHSVVPLPHILTLHMMYWCVVLLVHRPFIRHHKHTYTHTSLPEEEISNMSAKSFAYSMHAASRVSDLVETYRKNWDLRRANVFVSWYALSAGVMHVATLTMQTGDQGQARRGLQHCLGAFEQMKVVWPSSERAWQLLRGAELDLSDSKEPTQPEYSNIYPSQSLQRQQQATETTPQFPHATKGGGSVTYPAELPSITSQSPGTFPSLTTALGRDVNGPAPNMSYFPGYDYWPPESLVFDPPFLRTEHEEAKHNPHAHVHMNNGAQDLYNMSHSHPADSFGVMDPLRVGERHPDTDNAFGPENPPWNW